MEGKRAREKDRWRDIILTIEMVDLKYNRKKLPVLRILIYLIIMITLIIFIIKIREIFSFLEVLSK
jgi:hypothetical protein